MPAGRTRYRDSKGRDKVVHYWLMEPRRPRPLPTARSSPNDEVDAVPGASVAEAVERLTYAHDRKLLAKAPVPS